MGAWTHTYKYGFKPTVGSPHGLALLAFKKELIAQGYAKGMNPDSQWFGAKVRDRVKEFQRDHGLYVDGVIGPITAKHIFRVRAQAAATRFSIPSDYVCKIKSLESNNDPAAIGWADDDDRGLVQINLRIHNDITLQQATDPEFCLNWCAQYLANARKQLQEVGGTWDDAVVSYNMGVGGTRTWIKAGRPSKNDDGTIHRAANYLQLVKSQVC